MDINLLLNNVSDDHESINVHAVSTSSAVNTTATSVKASSHPTSSNPSTTISQSGGLTTASNNSLVDIAVQSLALLAGGHSIAPPMFPSRKSVQLANSIVSKNNVNLKPYGTMNQLPTPITPVSATTFRGPRPNGDHFSARTHSSLSNVISAHQNVPENTDDHTVTIPIVAQAFSLSPQEIKTLFQKIGENKNPAKSKRDTAMLCLLLDLKLACQRIADLQYRDIKGILEGTFQGIYRYSQKTSVPVKAIQCHRKTAQALKEWIDECKNSFGWTYEDTSPVFVPLACFGEQHRVRRIALKRDAISKVFAALKAASGISMSKEMINRTAFFYEDN